MQYVLTISLAVIIGCSPAFAILVRKRSNASKPSYNAQGYVKQASDNIRMKSMVSSSIRLQGDNRDALWGDAHSSQEELAKNAGRIVVKTTVHQDDEISSYNCKRDSTGGSWAVESHTGSRNVTCSTARH